MTTMRIEDYKRKMKDIGWTPSHIERLVGMYKKMSKRTDGQITVLEGDFNKKNLRRFEYMD